MIFFDISVPSKRDVAIKETKNISEYKEELELGYQNVGHENDY